MPQFQTYAIATPVAGDTLLFLDKSDTSANVAGTVKQALVDPMLQGSFDPVETTATAITIDDTKTLQDLISTATGAVTVTLSNTTADNTYGAISEGNQTITVQVATNVQYYLPGDDQAAAGRTTSFELRGRIIWEVKRIDAGNRRYLISGGTNHDIDLRGQVFTQQRSPYADTEITATRDSLAGDANQKMLRVNSASAVTYTVREDATVNWRVGTFVPLVRWGAGTLTIAAGAGVTINKPSDRALTARAQYSVVELWKQAANTYVLFGDLT